MAIIDYGAIAFKNGKLISTNMFTPMKDMVGWEDTINDVYHDYHTDKDVPLNLRNNYFAYIGDRDNTLAFYKCQIVTVSKLDDRAFTYHHEYLYYTNYIWTKWVDYIGGSEVKITKRNGYYVCKWKYKGDRYKVYFGYGVDLDYYKKWHIVNYYRSLEHRLYEIKRWFRNKSIEWRYSR